jgi:hypothetical protein
MADTAPAKAGNADAEALAERIRSAPAPEIATTSGRR